MVTSRKSFMVTRCLSIQNEPAKTGSFASNTSLSLSLRHSQIVKVTRFLLPIGSIIWDLQAWKHEAILVDIPKYPVCQYFEMISSYIPHTILATTQVQKSKAMRMPPKPTAITNSSLTWWMILCKSSMSPNCTFSYFFSSCDVFPRRCSDFTELLLEFLMVLFKGTTGYPMLMISFCNPPKTCSVCVCVCVWDLNFFQKPCAIVPVHGRNAGHQPSVVNPVRSMVWAMRRKKPCDFGDWLLGGVTY